MATATIRLPISKSVDANGALKVFGFGSMSVDDAGRLIVDHHRDVIEPAELEAAAYDFTKSARQLDVMHDRDPIGVLIESLYLSPEKAEAMGVGAVKSHGWWAGFEITDPATIARVKSGELAEMSIDCRAERWTDDATASKRITKAENVNDPDRPIGRLRNLKITMLSLVDQGAGKGVKVALWKRKKSMEPITLEMILAKLSPEEGEALQALLAAKPKADEPKAPEGAETPAAKALSKALAERDAAFTKMREDFEKMRAERDLEVEISKARAENLDFVAGVSIEEIAKLRIGASKESRPQLDAILKSAAEAHRKSGVLKIHGRAPNGDGNALTWDAVYEAAKKADPKADVIELQKTLAKTHPDLYRARSS